MTLSSIPLTKGKTIAAFIAMMVVFCAMRAADIPADPPPDLSISGALYSDEGFKTYAARNRALFGNWTWTHEDGYDAWLSKSPLSIYTFTRVFKKFGVSLTTLRSVSIVYAMLTLLSLFFLVKHIYGSMPALIGTFIMGFNFFNVMFSRLGFYEVHLGFFLITILACTVCALKSASPARRVMFCTIALLALAASWYIKRNVLIILIALIPVLSAYAARALQQSMSVQRRTFTALVVIGVIFYLVLAHSEACHNSFITMINTYINGVNLRTIIPFKSFDPVYLVAARTLYLEFIFLQPLVFFLSFTYGLYTLYLFLNSKDVHDLDVVLSGWFVFGFLLLSIMKYHPARYYIILSTPAAILSMRALVQGMEKTAHFMLQPPALSYRISLAALKTLLVLGSGIVLIVQAVPFAIRKRAIDRIYDPVSRGRMLEAIPVIMPYIITAAVTAAIVFVLRKKILLLFQRKSAGIVLLAVMIFFHLFQYGSWLASKEAKTHDLSKRLGRKLPHNAVIAGSWSAQLVLENGLRALIMQDRGTYNHDVMRKIIKNEPVMTASPAGEAGIKMGKDIPLYLVICPDVVFEQKIMEHYREFLRPENLVDGASLGYFDIKVYRIKK